MGEMTTIQEIQEARDAKAAAFIEGFTCPRCGDHQFSTDRQGESSVSWIVSCHHDKCGWSGRYREHVYNDISTMPPKALFAQLRKMGVGCRHCSKYLQDTSKVGSTGLCDTYFASMASADVFYCEEWEGK